MMKSKLPAVMGVTVVEVMVLKVMMMMMTLVKTMKEWMMLRLQTQLNCKRVAI